jgi:hypothetical protein
MLKKQTGITQAEGALTPASNAETEKLKTAVEAWISRHVESYCNYSSIVI